MRALVQKAPAIVLFAASVAIGCSNSEPACSAPGAGNFTVDLHYAQTIPVDLFCDSGAIDASSCGSGPHAFDGATWKIAVNSGTGTVTGAAVSWSCNTLSPRSSPSTTPDGSVVTGTGCYLALECGQQAMGDGGTAGVQIQLLTQASTDVVVLVHDTGADCCTDEYTGSWH